jgi:hypothetical protein
METKNLSRSVKLLKELLSELDQGSPTTQWRLRHRYARLIVKTLRLEVDYAKLKAKNPKAQVAFLEPYKPMTRAEQLLFAEVIDAHLAIYRRLKVLRELER